jgi:hypothetical protein
MPDCILQKITTAIFHFTNTVLEIVPLHQFVESLSLALNLGGVITVVSINRIFGKE